MRGRRGSPRDHGGTAALPLTVLAGTGGGRVSWVPGVEEGVAVLVPADRLGRRIARGALPVKAAAAPVPTGRGGTKGEGMSGTPPATA